jgi:hypothetical protein
MLRDPASTGEPCGDPKEIVAKLWKVTQKPPAVGLRCEGAHELHAGVGDKASLALRKVSIVP